MPFRRILVPVDFSEPSERAVDTACELAGLAEGQVELLHVCPVDPRVYPLGWILTEGAERDIRAAAEKALEEWRQRAAERGVPVTATVLLGVASEQIPAVARERETDLIVMGTHGRSGLEHVVLGSVAERTLRLAPCPVMTVRA
jgi:nucleotide-binding universal stress UspA family protein